LGGADLVYLEAAPGLEDLELIGSTWRFSNPEIGGINFAWKVLNSIPVSEIVRDILHRGGNAHGTRLVF